MDFKALNIPVDPVYKANSMQKIVDQSKAMMVIPEVKLNLMDVILNQARYLNHFTYIIYILALIIIMALMESSNYMQMMVTLAFIVGIFPLLTALECNDASRHGLYQLQKTYPFNAGLVMTIRFTYLTLLNTVVLTIYIVLINALASGFTIDMVSSMTLMASLLICSGSSLWIGLTIKKTHMALLINVMVNTIAQLVLIPLVSMVITSSWILQFIWCIVVLTIATLMMFLAYRRVSEKGFIHGYIGY